MNVSIFDDMASLSLSILLVYYGVDAVIDFDK